MFLFVCILDQNNIINDALGLSMDSTKRIGERRMPDMLDIPGKGQCYVYCARYETKKTKTKTTYVTY